MHRRFEGKSALVTGAARGQGRSHALHLAREGASVAICDICHDMPGVPYALGQADDLEETARQCRAEGARVLAEQVDVRDHDEVARFAEHASEELDGIDVLVANAGVFSFGTVTELSPSEFDAVIDTNLKGTWHVVKAVVPGMAERGYGRVVLIASAAALVGYLNLGHYVASKHGILGLTKSLALEQAANGVTVNCVCPTGVHTAMLANEAAYQLMNPDNPTLAGSAEALQAMNAIPRPWLEPEEVSKIVLFLASDDAAGITGAEYKIDMGLTAR